MPLLSDEPNEENSEAIRMRKVLLRASSVLCKLREMSDNDIDLAQAIINAEDEVDREEQLTQVNPK